MKFAEINIVSLCIASLMAWPSWGIKVLENQIKLGDFPEKVGGSGAKLEAGKTLPESPEGLTVCVRFMLKVLGGPDGRTLIWHLSSGVEDAGNNSTVSQLLQ